MNDGHMTRDRLRDEVVYLQARVRALESLAAACALPAADEYMPIKQ